MILLVVSLFTAICCISSVNSAFLIFGGRNVSKGINHKFVVSILVANQTMCGGSLITFDTVLSAAHCFDDYTSGIYLLKNYLVLAGTTKVNLTGVRKDISEAILHENYGKKSPFSSDILLLKLSSPFQKSDKIDIIHIAPKGFAWPVGDKGVLFGWGQTEFQTYPDDLLHTNVTFFAKKYCLQLMKAWHRYIQNSMQCAGEIEGGKDACDGDSGGPLVHITTSLLIGIVSWGKECGLANMAGIYTEVSAYNEWIYLHLS